MRRHFVLVTLFVAIFTVVLPGTAVSEAPYSIDWIRQFGTRSEDLSTAVVTDGAGNVYLTGSTRGSLDSPNAGHADAFLRKYDSTGTLQWSRQFGTAYLDEAFGVSVDGSGSVYVAGYSDGSLAGPHVGPAGSSHDSFLTKFDTSGNLLWSRQLGTTNNEIGYAVASDGLGNVFISGETDGSLGGPNAGQSDAFVSRYDASGALQWTRQVGTSSFDYGRSVAADGLGNVYFTGSTEGSLDGPSAGQRDAYLGKFDVNGLLQWTRQLGTAATDSSYGVSVDAFGNVYISGATAGALEGSNSGGSDYYLSKFDADGLLQWTRQDGTDSDELISASAPRVDNLGNVYVAGSTEGSLIGANSGFYDVFLSKFDSLGLLLWTQQFGSSAADEAWGLAVDNFGQVYISGITGGGLAAPNENGSYTGEFGDDRVWADVFFARLSPDASVVPEPSSIVVWAALLIGGGLWARRRRGNWGGAR